MKLYVTYTSPYARLARILVLEKGLADRVEIIEAKTRTPGSPYYQINPSGRVPYLIDDAGRLVRASASVSAVASICSRFASDATCAATLTACPKRSPASRSAVPE